MTAASNIVLEGTIALVDGSAHPHAASRFREAFPMLDLVEDRTLPAGHLYPHIELSVDASLPEGAFVIDVDTAGRPRISIQGGPFSGVIYGVEEVIQRLATVSETGVTLPAGRTSQQPGLPYRTFWNWDHSTNWDLGQIGVQEIGVMNPYAKPEDGFLADFKRVVNFMSQNRIAALTIYGFLRESHGGIEAAQELCRYATERGVRIIPGVAINAYGGIVWEMDHPYHLATWLRQHPELAAQMERPPGFQLQDLAFPLYFPNGDYSMRGCPSHKENQEWMADGIAWLAETFDIGGINIEAGDYGVCGCALCQQRRAERENAGRREGYAESWSHTDMADFYPRLYEAALSRKPDLWIYSEIQWDNLLDAEALAPLRHLPDGGIYQHTFNRSYWATARDQMGPGFAATLPTKQNVFRCQFCCQWNGDRRTERYFFNGRDFAEMAWKAAETGFQGLTVWGEPSPYNVATELSYLAFARISWNPGLTWREFIRQDVAPLLGGEQAAERFIAMTTMLDQQPNLDQAAVTSVRGEALDATKQTNDDQSRRWLWLAEQANRRLFMGVQ